MTTIAKLNELRVANGKSELKAWKQSKDKLEAAIAVEQDAFDQAEAKRLADEGEGQNHEDLPNQPEDQSNDTPSDLSDVEGQTEQPAAEVLIPRGAIGALSIEYLTGSDEPYADIVAKIVAKYPTAKTTARSLASVAMDLRRDGIEVPSRRKPAAVKPAKTAGETTPPAGE